MSQATKSQIAEINHKIKSLVASGIAEPNTWIESYQSGSKRKDGYKYYTYYRLKKGEYKNSSGKMQGKVIEHLGKEGSEKYEKAKLAIANRNQVQELQRRIHELNELDRQAQIRELRSQLKQLQNTEEMVHA